MDLWYPPRGIKPLKYGVVHITCLRLPITMKWYGDYVPPQKIIYLAVFGYLWSERANLNKMVGSGDSTIKLANFSNTLNEYRYHQGPVRDVCSLDPGSFKFMVDFASVSNDGY